jgi:transposase
MIGFSGSRRILVCSQPVDFRRGIDGLAALIQLTLKADPFCGDIYVFRSKRADRLKMLTWDGTGMILATKRLEDGRFTWPPIREGSFQLTSAQMAMLFEGLDWTRTAPKTVKRPLRAA